MARLIMCSKAKSQQNQWGFVDNDDLPVQKEKLLVIYVDDIVTKQRVTSLQVEINLKLLNQFKVDTLIKKELHQFLSDRNLLNKDIYFYDIYGNQIKYYSKSSKSYLFSTRSNLFWLFVRPFDLYLKQINKLDRGCSQSYHSENNYKLPVSKLKSCLSLLSVQQDVPKSPPTTHRGIFLTKELRNLQSVYDNYTRTTSVQSSRKFLSPQRKSSTIRIPKLNKQEKYFIENMQKCEDELQVYIKNMHDQLSNVTDDVERILNFYNQIQYPTPKSRVCEMKAYSVKISEPLQKILEHESLKNKFKPRHYYSEQQNWLEGIPLLTEMNIPKIQAQYQLNRAQLYAFYSIFKVLQLMTTLQFKQEKNKFTKGVSYEVYKQSIENIQNQSDYMAKGIFNIIDQRCSGFLDWQQFLFLMSSVQAKTKEERIDLFIKIADIDKNGKLSFPEVLKLSQQTMGKIVKTQDNQFLESITDFFTRVIFDSVNVPYDKEINFQELKDIITKGHPNSDLLCLFCGAEF